MLAPRYYSVCVMFVSFCMCPSELLQGVSPHVGMCVYVLKGGRYRYGIVCTL